DRTRQDRAEAAEHQRLAAELEAAGVLVTDELPEGATRLSALTHEGEDLTAETHASCPGRGAYFPSWNLLHPVHYCASPQQNGHTMQALLRPGGVAAGTVAPDALPDDPPADTPPNTRAKASPGRRRRGGALGGAPVRAGSRRSPPAAPHPAKRPVSPPGSC